jgi:hypothetical protein
MFSFLLSDSTLSNLLWLSPRSLRKRTRQGVNSGLRYPNLSGSPREAKLDTNKKASVFKQILRYRTCPASLRKVCHTSTQPSSLLLIPPPIPIPNTQTLNPRAVCISLVNVDLLRVSPRPALQPALALGQHNLWRSTRARWSLVQGFRVQGLGLRKHNLWAVPSRFFMLRA